MRFVLFILLLFIQQALFSSNQPRIIPEPSYIQFGDGNFTVNITTLISVTDSAILPITTLFTERIHAGTGIGINTVKIN